MKILTTPIDEKTVRELRIGDAVSITGTLFTMRDKAGKYIFEDKEIPFSLRGGIVFHCGPITIMDKDRWRVIAAGPTTSERLEAYQWKLIKDFGLRAIIGKGGMGAKTIEACKKFGCVYLSATGGAAQLIAEKITRVNNVYFADEFGSAEAVWELDVKDFPAIVTIDSEGSSLHEIVRENSAKKLKTLDPHMPPLKAMS